MYSGHRLIELLERQHQERGQTELFRKGSFTIDWRAKVGSFPHPDLETMISAGEPCGAWKASSDCPEKLSRPEAKRNVGDNWQYFRELPLNGYIPGSAIRGLVRSWAKKRPDIKLRMFQLLGYQDNDIIQAGKIEFLDAWPEKPVKLALDIVNPQESFQVFHQGQGTPLSFYTLGNGEDEVRVTAAIRGIPTRATAAEVAEVWGWVQQALTLYGTGSRTAAGYGRLRSSEKTQTSSDPNWGSKQFDFSLYSQGCAGPDMRTMELRPSHWRGWLRSWVLRFLLGIMSEDDAKLTLAELFGILEPTTRQGCVRLQLLKGKTWGDRSVDRAFFYAWKGKLQLSAPSDILNKIVLPIVRFAVMVGGVGKGWRRPLHVFHMNNDRAAARGCHLILTHQVLNKTTEKKESKPFGLAPKSDTWSKAYADWLAAAKLQWPNRVREGSNQQLAAEVFSPQTCAVYIVPGPESDPLERSELRWENLNAKDMRGDGMYLIYQETSTRNYKRNPDLGGNAAGGSNAHCSWASIKRVPIANKAEDTDCQEVVCLFGGGQLANPQHVRSRFLKDLASMSGAVHLFGVTP